MDAFTSALGRALTRDADGDDASLPTSIVRKSTRAMKELRRAAVGALAVNVAIKRAATPGVTVRGRARGNGDGLRCHPRGRGKFLAAMIPGDSAVESVITSGIFSTLNIYNTLLIGRLILTWFPNPPRQLAYPLATLCDPYLNLFRGVIPPLGGIDLSPILAFTVLNVFQGTAAALPCEYDEKTGEMKMPTKKERKWPTSVKRA